MCGQKNIISFSFFSSVFWTIFRYATTESQDFVVLTVFYVRKGCWSVGAIRGLEKMTTIWTKQFVVCNRAHSPPAAVAVLLLLSVSRSIETSGSFFPAKRVSVSTLKFSLTQPSFVWLRVWIDLLSGDRPYIFTYAGLAGYMSRLKDSRSDIKMIVLRLH